MAGLFYDDTPNGLLQFLFVTILLGGAGAIASGRAIAAGWKAFTIVPFYMVVLAAVVRFLHYALFGADLLSVPAYVLALVILLLAAGYGYRSKRVSQMTTQYSWIYAKSGPLGWTQKGA
ncbi:DUF6867 family protein [Lichenihabitans psoromatis]|uniref:DUF6867 family protein n=1 Tax=Lichenihabitans psoromatis TaxID=2528642 RepID=UPI001036C2D9|nr:hypothetical protein [Lichenihabitans psoromatis]